MAMAKHLAADPGVISFCCATDTNVPANLPHGELNWLYSISTCAKLDWFAKRGTGYEDRDMGHEILRRH